MKTLLAALALLCCAPALAQQLTPVTTKIDWTYAPKTDAPVKEFLLYIDSKPIPDDYSGTPSAIVPGEATRTYTWSGSLAQGSTFYLRMRGRMADGKLGPLSNTGIKPVPVVVLPNAPNVTAITITVEIK